MLIISKLLDNKIPFVSGHVFSHVMKLEYGIYYCFISENESKQKFLNIPGQIGLSTKFGSMLTYYAAQENGPRIWLEIGSWNGLGSTHCILNGFEQRLNEIQQPHLYSFELDPIMFDAAKENLKDHPAFSCATFINNKLVSNKVSLVFPSEDELSIEEIESEHFRLHYEREKSIWNMSKGFEQVLLPEAVLLDGGEYSGYLDWLSLDKTNLKMIFLDDTNCYKNKKVLEELEKNVDWNCIEKSFDRNGYAVFIKQ